MNKADLILELAKAISVDGRVNVDRYCKVLELIEAFNQHQLPQTHVMRWAAYPTVRPANYGRYLVYRAGCRKMHFETWNNTGWAYNNNDITHWTDVEPPIA